MRHGNDNYRYMGTYQSLSLKDIPSFGLTHKENVVFTSSPAKQGYLFDAQIDDTHQNHTLNTIFLNKVDLLREMHVNVLFIYEDLAGLDPRSIQALDDLLSPHWNVKVIVAYRPFHEFLISLYNELEKSKLALDWPATGKMTAIAPFDIALDDVGAEDISAHYVAQLFRDFTMKQKHPTKALSEVYAPFWGPAFVLQPKISAAPPTCDPLVDALVCQSLLDAPHLCQACRGGQFPEQVFSNPSVALDYDKLAVAAYERGWIPENVTRREAYLRIQQFQESMLGLSHKDFPLICLSQTKLDQLESASRDMEEDLFGRPVDANAFHSRFAAMNRTMCSIDTSRTLDDLSWQRFFSSNMTAAIDA